MPNLRRTSGEQDLIDALRARTGNPSKSSSKVRLGIGDDCAILKPPRNHEILVTTDFSLETVHFRRDWHTPESVGHRCLVRGLSDLAAMGAQPLAAFLSLALPAELVRNRSSQPSWRDRFFSGFLALAEKYQVPLAGGDTAQSPVFPVAKQGIGWALADIVLVGSAPRNRALLRSGAKAGDRIYVTGHLGGAAAELAQLAATPHSFRRYTTRSESTPNPHPHLFPEPRLTVGAWLLKNRHATAAIDISDGLSTDLDHLCRESGLAATVDASAIPIHPLAQNPRESLKLALNGGEDYELLFTASPNVRIPRQIAGVPIACIGQMRRSNARKPRLLLTEQMKGKKIERQISPGGWEHYR
jgi:thiamine-monophosphate kinase